MFDVAEALGLRRRIVLPFDPDTFLARSVADRPGDWVPRYRRHVDTAVASGNLIVLGFSPEDELCFGECNERILLEAQRLASMTKLDSVAALVAWEGTSRGPQDWTAHFGDLARAR